MPASIGLDVVVCEEGIVLDTETEKPYNTAFLVGVIVGVLVIVVFAAVLIVVIRRRRSICNHDSTKGKATEMQSSRVSTISGNENPPTSQNDPSQSSDPADKSSDKSEADVYAVAIPKSKRPRNVIYENVTLPFKAHKPGSQEPNTVTSSTTVQQNGTKKTKTTNKREGKPPTAPKPTQGRLSNAGPQTSPDLLPYDEEEDFKVTDAMYANEELYANIKPTGIRVDKLQQTVVNKLRDGSLEEEFMRMIPRKDFTLTNGERKENYYKNRYNSILPYDKNRVELEQVDGDDASDYVNASFVRGYKLEKAYIAAQGPRDNTVDDFWRMVWQEGVTDIIMLTNVKEGNKPKCYEYWPAQGDRLTTGHMEVTGVEEETRAHFVIRTFDLKRAQGSEKRRVKQYHYQSWMDHEVPATTPLVNFWRYVRSRAPRSAEAPPLVVHCSAGVGRTGTFIALDIVIDHAQQRAEVNIYNTVNRLRDDRCLMVQNKGQYAFLHEAVVEAYMSGDSRIQMSNMDTVLPHTVTQHTPSDMIDNEFETLCNMRDLLTSPSYTTANLKENRAKNRNPNALPNDQHLVYLTKHVKGRNQYINAVYMATFLQQRGSIMTQLPLPDTLVDMWRLVDGCDVNTIVSIGDMKRKKNMCCYWPKKVESPITTGPYTISLQSVAKLGDTLYSYTLQMRNDDTSREVRVLHYAGWTGQVADNMADLVHLLTTLHTSHHDRGGKPLIVQCIDGASQSGVVCALLDVISRMTCDAELDVYMAVRQLHTVRPEALTSVEQYRFCYAVAHHFKNAQNIYANT
ncbi:receptor-type tyrosine-protein phosphatase epsilon-like [Littorina saxatilis]|uniref:receptor-type tyrosine-protein phosphatase epsilon-like n=1 Tax=Littorina saxatilis TaxID=31220 RepID=UPI0038B67B09